MLKESNTTKQEQLYSIWYNNIMTDKWKAGEKIATERELCEQYSVSRSTVRETLRLLEQKGLISRTQGKGTFVNTKRVEQKLTKLYTLREQFKQMNLPHYSTVLDFSVMGANSLIAQNLKLDAGEKVIKIVRLFYVSDKPYTLETTYLPEHFFPEMTAEQVQQNGLYKTFAEYRITVQRAIEKLKPVYPSKTTAKLLATSDVAMKIERTSFWDQNLIEYTESVIRGDIFEYTVYLE